MSPSMGAAPSLGARMRVDATKKAPMSPPDQIHHGYADVSEKDGRVF